MPHYSERAPWTPENIELLTMMRQRGDASEDIARALGFSVRAVDTKAQRLNIAAPAREEWTGAQVEHLRALLGEGLTYRQIADQIGVSRNAVIGKVARMGLSGNKRGARKAAAPKPPRPIPMAKAKRVTLPPLPINGPVLTSDTSAAWLALPGTEPKTLTDLGADECRWPIGENPTLFCGCATEKTYCPAHAAIAYRQPVSEVDGRHANRIKRPKADHTFRAVP